MAADNAATSSGEIGTLVEHVDACLDIAERLGNGTDNWTDAPTLLAHLRVIKEDYCDA